MLSDSENRMIVFSFIWTNHRNVTDKRTDRHTDRQICHGYYSGLHCKRTRCKHDASSGNERKNADEGSSPQFRIISTTHLGALFAPRDDVLDVSAVRVANLALHHAASADASRLAHGTSRSSIPCRIPGTYNRARVHMLAADLDTSTAVLTLVRPAHAVTKFRLIRETSCL